MNKYQTYKDSGVEWVGEIPSHWKISKFKYETSLPVQYGINISSSNYIENGNRFIRTTDINENGGLVGKGVCVDIENLESNYFTNKFDFLISRSGTLGRCYIHLDNSKLTYGGYLVRFNFSEYFLTKFLFFYTKSTFFNDWLNLNTIVSTIGNVNGQKYNNLPFPLPSSDELKQIVSYLDQKTQKIDDLIKHKKRKIELLKEKRTSLINHVVTKGLDPNVEMKDSGVEWIGEIPIHWEVIKLKYLVNFDSGFSFKSGDYCEEGIPLIRIGSLYQNILSFDRSPIYLPTSFLQDLSQFVIQKDDILISMTGTLGKRDYGFSILYNEEFPSFLNQRVGRLRLVDDNFNLDLLMFCLLSESFLNQLFSKPSGTKQGNLSSDDITGNYICLSPLYEQFKIVNYLNEHTKEIDELIKLEQKKIKLLKEYRQSIISEVVTGKRRVCKEDHSVELKNEMV